MNRIAFLERLEQLGISAFSKNIPPNIGKYLKGVPHRADLVEIPEAEMIPIGKCEAPPKLDENCLKISFLKHQMELLFMQLQEVDDQSTDPQTNSLLEIGQEFSCIEEFNVFKAKKNKEYIQFSRQKGREIDIGICSEYMCLNPAVPGFSYCSCHLYQDSGLESQPFVKRCEWNDHGARCTNMHPPTHRYCSVHKLEEKNCD